MLVFLYHSSGLPLLCGGYCLIKLIYGAISYGGLTLINNSELDLPNMWVAYLPMFVGVYIVTQWLDRKIDN